MNSYYWTYDLTYMNSYYWTYEFLLQIFVVNRINFNKLNHIFPTIALPLPVVVGSLLVVVQFFVRRQILIANFVKEMTIVVITKFAVKNFAWIKTKEGMKQVKNEVVVNPQLLLRCLVTRVGLVVRSKGRHNSRTELCDELG